MNFGDTLPARGLSFSFSELLGISTPNASQMDVENAFHKALASVETEANYFSGMESLLHSALALAQSLTGNANPVVVTKAQGVVSEIKALLGDYADISNTLGDVELDASGVEDSIQTNTLWQSDPSELGSATLAALNNLLGNAKDVTNALIALYDRMRNLEISASNAQGDAQSVLDYSQGKSVLALAESFGGALGGNLTSIGKTVGVAAVIALGLYVYSMTRRP